MTTLSPSSRASSPPPLRLHQLHLRLPFLDRLASALAARYGLFLPPALPAWRRGLLVFLWLWQATLSYRSESLPSLACPRRRTRGLRLTLQTPLAGLDFSFRHPNWDHPPSSLFSCLTLSWWPVPWWRLREGQQVFRHGHTWEWERWEVVGKIMPTVDGGLRVDKWLERRGTSQPTPTSPTTPATPAPPPDSYSPPPAA